MTFGTPVKLAVQNLMDMVHYSEVFWLKQEVDG